MSLTPGPRPAPPSLAAEGARLLVLAMAVGALGGGAGLGFRWVADALTGLVWGPGPDLADTVAASSRLWRVLVPAVGGVLAGLVLYVGSRFATRERGWDLLEAVVLRDGVLHAGPTLVKGLSSLATVASGGAVGREGPIVLLSSTVASVFGRMLGLSTRHLRILVGCGVAAGISAAYNTPIGAALFTMEIIFGSFALEVFSPLVVASVVATFLGRAMYGNTPLFTVHAVELGQPLELVACVVLGLLAGLVAALFLQALRSSAAFFRRFDLLPQPLEMMVVGLLLGLALLYYPELVGNGREAVEHLFQSQFGLRHALALLALRLLLTPLTVGSGAVGGVFTPTLFVGAMLGNAFGLVLQPWGGVDPRAFAVVGMACLLAGTTHAPLTSVVMVFEMTLDYSAVVPMLLAAAVASVVATAFSRDSIYTEALRRKSARSEPRLLRLLTVRDVMRQEQITIGPDVPLPRLIERLLAGRRNHLYVVDAEGRFLGSVSLHDANRELLQGNQRQATSGDLLVKNFETTVPEEPINKVLDRFARLNAERLPVVEDFKSRRLIGTVARRDILSVISLDIMQRPTTVVDLAVAQDEEAVEIDVPAACIGLTVADCDLAGRYDVALVTIRRDGRWLLPEGDTLLQEGDRLLVTGQPERLAELATPPAS
jgi:CIC family chloride channel protein